MSAQHIPKLFTVEEWEQIPDPPGGRYELHHGELVLVTWPVWQHKALQRRLRQILEPFAGSQGYIVDTEYPYCPLPKSEVWAGDVVCFTAAREPTSKKWLAGSPELVIEVKSPSNTDAELHDRAMTTLAGENAIEFWIVDGKTETVKVYSRSLGVRVYRSPERVPVSLLGCAVALDELFADLK